MCDKNQSLPLVQQSSFQHILNVEREHYSYLAVTYIRAVWGMYSSFLVSVNMPRTHCCWSQISHPYLQMTIIWLSCWLHPYRSLAYAWCTQLQCPAVPTSVNAVKP